MAEISKKTPKNIVFATRDTPWETALEPFRVAPRIYYVGNRFVGSFLIDTSEGLALIDTTVFETVYMLVESIRELGFDPRNIKKIFLTHAHMDHDGGARCIQELSGAEIYEAKEDDEWRKRPEADMSGEGFKIIPYTVDHYYDDDTPIVMGDVTIPHKTFRRTHPGMYLLLRGYAGRERKEDHMGDARRRRSEYDECGIPEQGSSSTLPAAGFLKRLRGDEEGTRRYLYAEPSVPFQYA